MAQLVIPQEPHRLFGQNNFVQWQPGHGDRGGRPPDEQNVAARNGRKDRSVLVPQVDWMCISGTDQCLVQPLK